MPTFRRSHFMDIALALARRIHAAHNASHKHVAFLFGQRQHLLATSTNKVGSRSFGAGYSTCTIHAERAVLKAVGDIRKLAGATLVVIRVGSRGELKDSRPCSECQRHLEKCMRCYGLRRVFYS